MRFDGHAACSVHFIVACTFSYAFLLVFMQYNFSEYSDLSEKLKYSEYNLPSGR